MVAEFEHRGVQQREWVEDEGWERREGGGEDLGEEVGVCEEKEKRWTSDALECSV